MASVTPEKNEAALRSWQKERRFLRWFPRVVLGVIIAIIIVYPLVYPFVVNLLEEESTTNEKVIAPGLDQRWSLPIVVALSLFYVTLPIGWRPYMKRRLGPLSTEACVFLAIVTAEDLERVNPVRASVSVDRLLLALSDFLGQKLVALGVSLVTPKDFMYITPETIPKRAVRRAIQASQDTKDFQERLCNLAIGLRGNVDAGYCAAHQFLVWLDKKAESYRLESQSFLDKRPTLRTIVLQIAPIIVPPVSAIIIVLLR